MISQTREVPGRPLSMIDGAAMAPFLIVAAVFAMRWPFLGNPMIHVDEQFYLLAGQRLTEGWVPYADFWDRKPVGLFLIYGAIRLLGGDGVVQYQLVATMFAAATAWVVYLIASRQVAAPAAFAAAIVYGALLAPINGAGGQSPVFYNLLMAGSALLVLRAGEATEAADYRRKGAAAMLLAGLALQIKSVAAIEGVFFGLWLVHAGGRHWPGQLARLRGAAMFATIALIPTLAAMAWFAAAGEFRPFWHANFVSVFQRAAAPDWFERDALLHTLRMLMLALAGTAAALALAWLRGPAKDRAFVTLWLVFAVAGYLAIGNYFDHYALPLLVPVAVVLARLFAVSRLGPVVFALLILQATVFGLLRYSPAAASRALTASMTAKINSATARGECLFVADTPLALYLTTKACGPWRYSFPFHLIDATEAGTGEGDQGSAMRAILGARPGAIVTGSPHFPPTVQAGNIALLDGRLAADYLVAGRYPDRGRTYTVWIRRDLAPRPRPAEPQ